jgi:Spy/CpxP family protein refolding chaperone
MKILPRLFVAAALGGLVNVALASSKPGPLPTTPPGSQAILLGVDGVRKELGLSSLQKAVLNDIRAEYREETRAVVAKAGTSVESKKAAQARLDALTATYNRRALRALSEDQLVRFNQIERQILGAYVLLDAKVQNQLALTPKQREKLAYVYWRLQKTASAINRDYEAGRISYYQRMIALRDNRIDRSDDLLERLTREQRAKLRVLEGDKFHG